MGMVEDTDRALLGAVEELMAQRVKEIGDRMCKEIEDARANMIEAPLSPEECERLNRHDVSIGEYATFMDRAILYGRADRPALSFPGLVARMK